MQILFNELSLIGQFSDQNSFVKNGLLLLVGVLKEMQFFSMLLLKKSDVWNNKITPLTWSQIHSDKGLDYKEYHGNISMTYHGLKTYKFKASQKFRCHGFRKEDLFIVIGFETDHKLSDRG